MLAGPAIENEDSLRLAHDRGIRDRNEIMPLSEAPKAYERMMSGNALPRRPRHPRVTSLVGPSLDELLAAVDVVSRAGQRRVGHQMDDHSWPTPSVSKLPDGLLNRPG